jgi:hypothetical protein
VAALAAIAVHGLWRVLPWERFALSLLLALLSMALAWPLHRFARWSLATSLLAVWTAALVVFVGPFAMLAALLLAAAALAIGLRLAPQSSGQGALALAIGLMAIAGATGWILMLPVHHPLAWSALLFAIALSQRARLAQCARDMQAGWRREIAASPAWAAFTLLLLGLASTACWLPTMQSDDLTYHLGLPTHLLVHLRYIPAPEHQVWSFAPWAGDALHGIVAVLSRGEARGALNALWLGIAAATAWAAIARLSASADERWACAALLASFPPLVWLAAGMQTELPAIAVLMALAAVVLPASRPRGAPAGSDAGQCTLAAAVLLGGLAALKPVHLFAALPLLAYAGWQQRAHWPWRRLLIGLVIMVLVGGSSYWFAWQRTGNPLLPLFNESFASPYFPLRDFDDPRWHVGFGPMLLWDLVVDTDRYLEAWDGGLGIAPLALSGAWLVALLRPDARAFTIAATLTVVLPLLPLQYARYAFPGMALLLVAVLPGVEAVTGRRLFAWMIAGICVVNLAFQANSGWTHHTAALKRVLRTGGDAPAIFPHYVPERTLIAAIPEGDGSIVLATDPLRGYIAELAGRGRAVSSHDPTLEAARIAADADASGSRWQALFAASRAHWILMTPSQSSTALRKALIDARAKRVARAGDAELWRLPERAPRAGLAR